MPLDFRKEGEGEDEGGTLSLHSRVGQVASCRICYLCDGSVCSPILDCSSAQLELTVSTAFQCVAVQSLQVLLE